VAPPVLLGADHRRPDDRRGGRPAHPFPVFLGLVAVAKTGRYLVIAGVVGLF
jgi:hypothetical protein